MKISFLFIFILLFFSSQKILAQKNAPIPDSTRHVVEAQVKDFYHWYIHLLNEGGDPLSPAQRSVIKKYVSARRLARIDKLLKIEGAYDADYFLDAQDWDNRWEKNISVSGFQKINRRIRCIVTLQGDSMPNYHLDLELERMGSIWKIEKVSGIQPK